MGCVRVHPYPDVASVWAGTLARQGASKVVPRFLSPAELKRLWNCAPYAVTTAYGYLASFTAAPPYIAPEAPVKELFATLYPAQPLGAYKAWFGMSGLKIVTRSVGGTSYTGIDCATGIAPLVMQCRAMGGCGASNPCDCETLWWMNKPDNPC